jgi:hypothetical protein
MSRYLLAALFLATALAGPAAAAPVITPQPPIRVLFIYHFDPVLSNETLWRQQEDNTVWLKDHVLAQPVGYRPEIALEMQGDHAEFYLRPTDPDAVEGRAALRALLDNGSTFGTHMHNVLRGTAANSWSMVTMPGDGDQCNDPLGMTEAPDATVNEIWQDQLAYVEPMWAMVTGITPTAPLNQYTAVFLPRTYLGKHLAFSGQHYAVPHGFSIETGGRDECLTPLFDHDVLWPWRPGTQGALDEDLAITSTVMVPSLAALGAIGPHMGRQADNSVPARQRMFLEEYAERLVAQYGGTLDRVWTFGWHEHPHDLYPTGMGGGNAYREEVVTMTNWLNTRFVNRSDANGQVVAVYANPSDAAAAFLDWEAAHPGVSSFEYNITTTQWISYPFALKGMAQQAANAHYETAYNQPDDPLQVYRLARCPSALRGETNAYWVASDAVNGTGIACRQTPNPGSPLVPTTTVYLAWRDAATAVTLDFSAYTGPYAAVYDGLTGLETGEDPHAVSLAYTPKVLVPHAGPGATATPAPSLTPTPSSQPVMTSTFYLNVTYPPTITTVLSMPVTIVRPADGQPHPAVVLVPGGNGASWPAHGRSGTASTIASWGYTVVYYELIGRYDPSLPAAYPPCTPLNCNWEYPIDDYAGVQEQTEFNALLDWLVNAPLLENQIRRLPPQLGNRRMIGIHTSSFGITIATGALALRAPAHPQNDVLFVLDIEGPEAKRITALAPDPGNGCQGGGHISHACNDPAFWDPSALSGAGREAVDSLGQIGASGWTSATTDFRYLRLQKVVDHVQGTNRTHMQLMLESAQAHGLWFQLNARAFTGEIENTTPPNTLPDPAEINTCVPLSYVATCPLLQSCLDPNDPQCRNNRTLMMSGYIRDTLDYLFGLYVVPAATPTPTATATATATPTATAAATATPTATPLPVWKVYLPVMVR